MAHEQRRLRLDVRHVGLAHSTPDEGSPRKDPSSGLACLAVGIAAVTFRLARCFVFKNAGDAAPVGNVSSLRFGVGRCGNRCNPCGLFNSGAVLFFKSHLRAFAASQFASLGNCNTFGLTGFSARFRRFLGSAIGLQ